jgi:hypothetical protein
MFPAPIFVGKVQIPRNLSLNLPIILLNAAKRTFPLDQHFSQEDKKMGAGVGKMFGIDKIFGGFMDAIGLGALKPLVNIAFDFATGNIPGVIQDLSSLVSSFGNGNFTNNVANKPPLPDAFNSGNEVNESYRSDESERGDAVNNCCRQPDNGDLSSNRLAELFHLLSELFKGGNNPSDTMHRLSDLFKLLSENSDNQQMVRDARTNVQFAGNITATA